MSLSTYLKELLAAEAALPMRAEVIERLRARGDLVSRTGTPVRSIVDEIHRAREERTAHLQTLVTDRLDDSSTGPEDPLDEG